MRGDDKGRKTKRTIARRTEKPRPRPTLSPPAQASWKEARKTVPSCRPRTAASTVETVYCLLRSGGSSDRPLHWRYYWTSAIEHGGFRTRMGTRGEPPVLLLGRIMRPAFWLLAWCSGAKEARNGKGRFVPRGNGAGVVGVDEGLDGVLLH